MGAKDQLELKQQDQDHDKKRDVDADGEHDRSRAHTHSNAALHRVADAGKSDPKRLHEAADSRGYGSVQSGLLLLAKEMHLAKDELAAAMQDDPEHNNQLGVSAIDHIVHMIAADAYNLNLQLGAIENKQTMGLEVKTVWGAWFFCQHYIARALTWYKANGGTNSWSVDSIDQSVKAMIAKLGTTPDDLEQIRKEPDGDAKAMSDQAFEDELAAASGALDSIEAGNSGDANRLKLIAQHIGAKAGYSSAYQRHAKAVAKLKARVDQARAKDPSNQALGEAAFSLAKK